MRLPKLRFFVIVVVVLAIFGAGMFISRSNESNNSDQASQVKVTEITYGGAENKNALELLKDKHTVETIASSFGEYVKTIDGVSADSSHFWGFYVNGKMAEVGAGSYVTKNEDTITWKLEVIQQ